MTLPSYSLYDKLRREDKIKLQEAYCKHNKLPNFIPKNGKCFKCDKFITDRYSEEAMQNEHITSCPWCNTSFTD